jgi:hypothetical protein
VKRRRRSSLARVAGPSSSSSSPAAPARPRDVGKAKPWEQRGPLGSAEPGLVLVRYVVPRSSSPATRSSLRMVGNVAAGVAVGALVVAGVTYFWRSIWDWLKARKAQAADLEREAEDAAHEAHEAVEHAVDEATET